MFNPQNDPLGIGLMARARAARQVNPTANFGRNVSGPLPDPRWDAFFQALGEQGVTRLADTSVGAARGMWKPTSAPATYDPNYQTTAVRPSNQLNQPASYRGLLRATGRK